MAALFYRSHFTFTCTQSLLSASPAPGPAASYSSSLILISQLTKQEFSPHQSPVTPSQLLCLSCPLTITCPLRNIYEIAKQSIPNKAHSNCLTAPISPSCGINRHLHLISSNCRFIQLAWPCIIRVIIWKYTYCSNIILT